jgi:methylmalonyl-CoA mutase N-terminal domain/subunit
MTGAPKVTGDPDELDGLPPVRTDSGIPVKPLYRAEDVDRFDQLEERLGEPGSPPFTRGPYRTMYRSRLWTMRQFAGYGSPEETNARYRFLLERGQTALSVAFDLPTQLGYDSDDPAARFEVGRVGVAIDTADDLGRLFDGLPLDRLSVNFTINATAPIILAFYLVAAERQGVNRPDLSGTLQNDILKEFLARKLYVFPPRPSMRLVADVVEFCTSELPRFNPISVTGYHAREAGCNAVQELGLTMASGIAYSTEICGRGLPFDTFAPRLSFHFATTLDLFEEVAKLRAARRLWHAIATERFGAQDPASGRLRFFSGCSGASLTSQQPLNNLIRSTIQCLGAVLGGAQSIHVMGYDEALEIPTEEAVTLALRTQQILAYESGATRTADPLAGSYYVESLTDELERRAGEIVKEIDSLGGAVAAIERGVPQRWIAEAAYAEERAVTDGDRVKVGVNRFVDDAPHSVRGRFEFDPTAAETQAARIQAWREARLGTRHEEALADLERAAKGTENVMPILLDCARAGVTMGEMGAVLRSVLGEYKEPPPW